jgi:hypothetical protein
MFSNELSTTPTTTSSKYRCNKKRQTELLQYTIQQYRNEFCNIKGMLQNIWVASYGHHESDPKHHYIIANLNYEGFQELELSNLTLLNINKLWSSVSLSQNPLTTTHATYTHNTHYTIWQKLDCYFFQSFNILIDS